MSEENPDDAIKIILVGDSGTGKTNLITVAAGFDFNHESITTTSCSYIQKTVTTKNGKEYKINLWDTIGQEKYRSLTKIFIKDSKIVIFVYDITNRASFESLKYWNKTIEEILGQDPVFGIVGNKVDLYLQEKVKQNEGEQFAESIGAKFKLTSAKNDPKSISDFIVELLEEYEIKNGICTERIDSMFLDKDKIKKENEKCCSK